MNTSVALWVRPKYEICHEIWKNRDLHVCIILQDGRNWYTGGAVRYSNGMYVAVVQRGNMFQLMNEDTVQLYTPTSATNMTKKLSRSKHLNDLPKTTVLGRELAACNAVQLRR